ncbi:hypothetical protein, partial [Klebsiella pneumoniae]|uniref:hypothetical protein n=1 Tax=Klebsiella pneumoniae TaxID=573 RepID=UPI002109A11B
PAVGQRPFQQPEDDARCAAAPAPAAWQLPTSHPSSPQPGFASIASLGKGSQNLFFLRISFLSNFVSEALEDKLKTAKQNQQ